MHIHFPFQIDSSGRTRSVDDEEYVRQLIEQLLFTAPGERVNRPDFGTGLPQLLFEPTSPELAAATQFTVQGALQQWLGDLITVQSVAVDNRESTLTVMVRYTLNRNRHPQTVEFTKPTMG